jgi:hypothetical protein
MLLKYYSVGNSLDTMRGVGLKTERENGFDKQHRRGTDENDERKSLKIIQYMSSKLVLSVNRAD